MPDFSLFEAMHTQRAIRRFTKAPVSDEAINTIMEATIRAPNGSNLQAWNFLVIRDTETKRRLSEWYLDGWTSRYPNVDPSTLPQAVRSGPALGRSMADVPVLILVCVDHSNERPTPLSIISGASIFPAVQNLMLAARALGLGTVLTTLHRSHEDEVKELLGIPESVETVALIPLGYPAEGEHFGGSRRKPVEEVTFYDRWGQKK